MGRQKTTVIGLEYVKNPNFKFFFMYLSCAIFFSSYYTIIAGFPLLFFTAIPMYQYVSATYQSRVTLIKNRN